MRTSKGGEMKYLIIWIAIVCNQSAFDFCGKSETKSALVNTLEEAKDFVLKHKYEHPIIVKSNSSMEIVNYQIIDDVKIKEYK